MGLFNPLVSIIIPVYNGSNYLGEAIESALAQTYQNIEILVINDGSEDENKSEKIALSYGNKLRYFHKKNGGVSSALNLGISKMNGDYFSWLSHDDTFYKNKIELQINCIKTNKKIKIVNCNFKTQGIETHTKIYSSKVKIFKCGRDILQTWIHFCSLLIDKETIIKAGKFNEKNLTCQDIEMLLNLVSLENIYNINETLVIRREHETQGSRLGIISHLKEKEKFYKSIFEMFQVDFFHDSKTPFHKHSVLCFLGDYCMSLGLEKAGKYYFKKAIYCKLFSPRAILILLFGKVFWKPS